MAEELIRELHAAGLKLHAFGFKLGGLRRVARYLESSDSMAWSFGSREFSNRQRHPDCTHRNCSHCWRWALLWRQKVLRAVAGSQAAKQLLLF